MKIAINTLGTRGDVQPYVALGFGLSQAGHNVRVLTHRIFESFVKQYGLEVYSLDIDPRQVLIDQSIYELGNNFLRISRWMEENFQPIIQEVFQATLAANQEVDLILNSGLSFAGWHIAEKLEIPAIAAYLWPVTASRYLPSATGRILPSWLPFKGLIYYTSTKVSNQFFFRLMLPLINRCRKNVLDLPPLTARDYWSLDNAKSHTPLIYGYSPAVSRKPPDWGENQQITGYWFLDTKSSYQPDSALLDFLAEGTPPICIGFGSMVDHEKEEISQIVLKVLSETGQRGIILGDWSAIRPGTIRDTIFQIGEVPHDWLFPHMAAIVHHGGAGTTAAGLKAGIPSVVVPYFADQFFWGWRIKELGVGPQPVPRRKLTTQSLEEAIRIVIGDERIKSNAARISKQIRDEDGVCKAVSLIETFHRSGRF